MSGPKLFADRFGLQIYFEDGDHHFAGFDFTPASCMDQACDEVQEEYGEPSKGLMVVRYKGRIATSDGINSATGEPYTSEEVAIIRSLVDELIVLD